MASLVEIKGNYYLQFYDGNKSPSQKKVSSVPKRKRVVKKLKRKYEDGPGLSRLAGRAFIFETTGDCARQDPVHTQESRNRIA
jgi:hypothetical protein